MKKTSFPEILNYIKGMVIGEMIRRFLVKRKTFDNLNRSHFQLQAIGRDLLKLHSAHFQDLWVLSEVGFKTGYFVEFGGYDGKASSNTYCLEKEYGWTGIIVEPGFSFRESLISNRSCVLDYRAVWDKTGEKIGFKEDVLEGYLSVAVEDSLVDSSNESLQYLVDTVTLFDLLSEHGAPESIDYISVDIEGSELRVLTEFFERNDRFDVRCWTVEHNFKESRDNLERLFSINGYIAVNKELSYRDYWFIKQK